MDAGRRRHCGRYLTNCARLSQPRQDLRTATRVVLSALVGYDDRHELGFCQHVIDLL